MNARIVLFAVTFSLLVAPATFAQPAAATEPKPDFFDPIKHINVNDDGSIWLSIGGQTRLRFESWNNFGFLDGPGRDDDFLLTRILLNADLHIGERVRVFIEGKSAMSTDNDDPVGNRTLEVDELDLQNAYLDLILPLQGDSTLTLRGGRQELLFGKQRLVSPLDWANSRRTFDGFSAILAVENLTLTGFWTRTVPVQKYDFNDSDANSDFFGLYATTLCPVTGLKVDLYYLGLDRDADAVPGGGFNGTPGNERRHTVGARFYGKIGETGLDVDVESAYQFGTVGSADISAWMFASEVGYTFKGCPTAPRLHLGFDYASGDRSPGGDVQTFNQLFPLGHAYLGWADVIGRQNIIDISPGLTFKPIDKLTARAVGHLFWRADADDALYNAGSGVVRSGLLSDEREVGAELDLLLTYKFNTHLEASVGYSRFFAGDFIKESGAHDDIDFFYSIVQFTF